MNFLGHLKSQLKSHFLPKTVLLTLSFCISLGAGALDTPNASVKQNPSSSKPNSPKVIVSIPPFQALVAGVMEGVGTPELLLTPGASLHHYSLKPSQIKKMQQADIFFWGGPALESFLASSIKNLKSTYVVELNDTPDLYYLPQRREPLWPEADHDRGGDRESDRGHDRGNGKGDKHSHNHTHTHSHPHDHSHGSSKDMHYWLNPSNGIRLVERIAKELSKKDPANQKIYQENAKRMKDKIRNQDKQIRAKLTPLKKIPFLVFHDGYQYFERYYGLNAVGAISLHPETPLSLERIKLIRAQIARSGAQCIFSEPQFKPKIVQQLVKDTHLRTGELDPEGANIPNDANGYFVLMDNLANSLSQCLSKS